jgi:hypothetical protein
MYECSEKTFCYIAPDFLEENVLQKNGKRTGSPWRQAGGLRDN